MTANLRNYFVVMRDFGKIGYEAVVDPTQTRADIVNCIASGEYDNVVFIHHVNAGIAFDVTDDLMAEAFRPEDDASEDTPAAIRDAMESDRGMNLRREVA